MLAVAGCRENRLQQQHAPPDTGVPYCGDGVIDPGEQCDGMQLDGGSCSGLGFEFGTLSCAASCTYDTSQCVKLCGNGVLDPGEQCDGDAGDLSCTSWGYTVCSPTCTRDSTHCLTTTFQPGIPLTENPGGRTLLAPVPQGPLWNLVMATPSPLPRISIFPYDLNRGFQALRRIQGTSPVSPIAADFDGDGLLDLAAINLDGSIDHYTYDGGLFVVSPAWSGTCAATAWVGAGIVDAGAPPSLVALACSQLLVVPQLLPATGITAGAMGDVNGDGLQDVLAAIDGGVSWCLAPALSPGPTIPVPLAPTLMATADLDGDGQLDLIASDGASIAFLQGTDGGFASRMGIAAHPSALVVQDLDLDGRPDVAWLDPTGVHVRRSQGNFLFGIFDIPLDAGTPLSLSAGDIDADGDPDLAATFSLGGASTLTIPLLNGVK